VGSVVVADEQASGIGRHGHAWESRAYDGLYVSLVLQTHPVLTLALGLAGHAAVQQVTSLKCDIRWPNDLLLADKKLGGILVQMHDARAVAGIGINIGQRRFTPDLAKIATSLFLETGLEFRRDDLLQALLDEIPRAAALSAPAVIAEWTAVSSWARGKAVWVEMGSRILTGLTDGLDPAGYLRVRKANGDVELVLAGGVRSLANEKP
jgi:BirA family biotin operon repressor/biotin-[acetyl-CoA-carboxylase] ligase